MAILSAPLQTGHGFPYGAVLTENGVNFAVFSRSAKASHGAGVGSAAVVRVTRGSMAKTVLSPVR